MSEPIRVVVIRHSRERVAKCSLRFLHGRPEFTFLRGSRDLSFDATDHILLAVDAPVLTRADRADTGRDRPLLVLDSTWRWLPQLRSFITGVPVLRSIPNEVRTAYPRASRTTPDPPGGLASVEAVYVARLILGDQDDSLLDGYHWKDAFLASLGESVSRPWR